MQEHAGREERGQERRGGERGGETGQSGGQEVWLREEEEDE